MILKKPSHNISDGRKEQKNEIWNYDDDYCYRRFVDTLHGRYLLERSEIVKSYEVFRKLMFDHHMRKADVIRATGVSRPTLLKWEKGTLPSLKVLEKIARCFNVSVKDFIED